MESKKIYEKIGKEINKKFGFDENHKFDFCISNPPYQIATGGKNHNIYDKFYFIGSEISKQMSMIFLMGWQTSSGRASGSSEHHLMREDKHISSLYNYLEDGKNGQVVLFKTASTGGVNIINWKRDYDNNGLVNVYEYDKFIGKKDLTVTHQIIPEDKKIFDKLDEFIKIGGGSMREIITGRNPCGLLTYYTNPSNDGYAGKELKFKEFKNSIKFWSLDGNDNKYKWFWIRKDYQSKKDGKIKITDNNQNKFKLIWPKSGAWANWRSNKKMEPGEYFSDTFINCYFDKAEERDNFLTYFKTFLYRFCEVRTATDHNAVRIVHVHVPNLSSEKNPRTGRVGWGSDWTNEDLKKVFSFITEEEWKYIEDVAIKSDSARKSKEANIENGK